MEEDYKVVKIEDDPEERELTKALSFSSLRSVEQDAVGCASRKMASIFGYVVLGFMFGLWASQLLSPEKNDVKHWHWQTIESNSSESPSLAQSDSLPPVTTDILSSTTGGQCMRDFSLESNLMKVLNSMEIVLSRAGKSTSISPAGCGGESPTLLQNTVKAFANNSFISVESDSATLAWRRVTVYFRAVSSADTVRNFGGDEFVMTFLGWTSDGVKYKSASISKDYSNGTYSATLDIPHAVVDFHLSLTHLYTCYSGLARASSQDRLLEIPDGEAGPFKLDFHLPSLVPIRSNTSFSDELSSRYQCSPSQDGVDGMRNVLWVDKQTHAGDDLSTSATWVSACCSTANYEYPYESRHKYRIGDSTMPSRNVEVGDIFEERNFHNRWIDFLSSTMQSAPAESTVLINSGLHFLKNYNPPAAALLVTRLLCQLAAFYKGKVVFVGSVPVQQALFTKVDGEKDGSVLWLNKLVHERIVRQGKGRLADICLDPRVNVTSLEAEHDSMGNLKAESVSRFADEVDHRKFLQDLHSLDLAETYGSRHVFFAHIHDVILARPESYRTHDKIHDAGGLFFGEHSRYISELEKIRAMGPP